MRSEKTRCAKIDSDDSELDSSNVESEISEDSDETSNNDAISYKRFLILDNN